MGKASSLSLSLAACSSYVYSIQLDTGHAQPMNHRFEQHIRRLIVSPDQQHLYVRSDKILPRPPSKAK
uniref:Uncharacterized protein n=1 Tax=Ditylenchus dipsaci TaxID=166011 RepID=A0A915EW40_9BILA